MIRRDTEAGWILISQVDHAHLAAEIAGVWGNDRITHLPEIDCLLPAIRDHDDGWQEWERLPDIHPESHFPRNFTEMPPEDATRIWTRSIELCRRGRQSIVASVEEFRRFLSLTGLRFTHERAIVAEEVFSSWDPFSAEEILSRLPQRDDGRKVSRSALYRTLTLMEEARLLRKVSLGTYRDAYEQTRQIGAGSQLGGIWVSQHFTFLAERAHEHEKSPHPAWDDFLEEQSHLQSLWTADIQREYGHLEAGLMIETGTRWVQFFDVLSLWFCCRERSQTESFETPYGDLIHFTPLKSGEVAVEPFPFSVSELELNVDTKRVLKKTFENRAEFQSAYDQSAHQSLEWKLVRW